MLLLSFLKTGAWLKIKKYILQIDLPPRRFYLLFHYNGHYCCVGFNTTPCARSHSAPKSDRLSAALAVGIIAERIGLRNRLNALKAGFIVVADNIINLITDF